MNSLKILSKDELIHLVETIEEKHKADITKLEVKLDYVTFKYNHMLENESRANEHELLNLYIKEPKFRKYIIDDLSYPKVIGLLRTNLMGLPNLKNIHTSAFDYYIDKMMDITNSTARKMQEKKGDLKNVTKYKK